MRPALIAVCACLAGCGATVEHPPEPVRANLCLEPFPECEPWDVRVLLGKSYASGLREIREHASTAYILSVDGMRRPFPSGNVPWRIDLVVANNVVVEVRVG